MRLFDRLRDPFFEPRYARLEFIEPRVDFVETPQHARFEPGHVGAYVENLPFDVLKAKLDSFKSALDQAKPARHPIEACRHRLMK